MTVEEKQARIKALVEEACSLVREIADDQVQNKQLRSGYNNKEPLIVEDVRSYATKLLYESGADGVGGCLLCQA